MDARKRINDKRKATIKRAQLDDDVRRVALDLLGNAQGRQFLWITLGQDKCDDNCFTGNSQTYFAEGRKYQAVVNKTYLKAVSLKLYHMMEAENGPYT